MSSPTSKDMLKYGRNMARAMNQKSARKATKPFPFPVGEPKMSEPKQMPHNEMADDNAVVANEGSPRKATKIRGTGAATKGTMARGPMG
jgi:hypothetical protein